MKNLNKVEVRRRLKELQTTNQFLQMKDCWTEGDTTVYRQNNQQINYLKDILKGLKFQEEKPC